jgi:hypothetical protein
MKKLPILFFAIGSMSILSCKSRSNSETKYGALSEYQIPKDHWLVGVPPGGTILVCGQQTKSILDAVKTWARTLGREEKINFKESSDCNESVPAGSAKIQTYDGLVGPHGTCPNFAAAATYNDPSPFGFTIQICNPIRGSDVHAMLHEVGHTFGLCDQYGAISASGAYERVGMHPTCDSTYNSIEATSSIMSADYSVLELSADDILGIRILGCRADIPGNLEWEQVAVEKIAEVKTEVKRLNEKAGKNLFLPSCLDQQVAENDEKPEPQPQPGKPESLFEFFENFKKRQQGQ